MKERPILFSAPMVRALLDGRKTQTRRIVKPQPTFAGFTESEAGHQVKVMLEIGAVRGTYGQPGDRLWVRETYSEFDTNHGKVVWYRAESDDPDYWHGMKWTPSIFMPKRLSRITLEIVNVRVERLQDISEADAMAEGIMAAGDDNGFQSDKDGRHYFGDPVNSYAALWESINGPGSWDANPWVWVIEFSRVQA